MLFIFSKIFLNAPPANITHEWTTAANLHSRMLQPKYQNAYWFLLRSRPDNVILCKETGNRNSTRELYALEPGRISSRTLFHNLDPTHLKLSEKNYANVWHTWYLYGFVWSFSKVDRYGLSYLTENSEWSGGDAIFFKKRYSRLKGVE